MAIEKQNACVDRDACIGCGVCESICPVGAIKMVDGKAFADSTCNVGGSSCSCGSSCGSSCSDSCCVSACPVGAIKIKSCKF